MQAVKVSPSPPLFSSFFQCDVKSKFYFCFNKRGFQWQTFFEKSFIRFHDTRLTTARKKYFGKTGWLKSKVARVLKWLFLWQQKAFVQKWWHRSPNNFFAIKQKVKVLPICIFFLRIPAKQMNLCLCDNNYLHYN